MRAGAGARGGSRPPGGGWLPWPGARGPASGSRGDGTRCGRGPPAARARRGSRAHSLPERLCSPLPGGGRPTTETPGRAAAQVLQVGWRGRGGPELRWGLSFLGPDGSPSPGSSSKAAATPRRGNRPERGRPEASAAPCGPGFPAGVPQPRCHPCAAGSNSGRKLARGGNHEPPDWGSFR